MEEKISFASLGRVEAIRRLYEGSGFEPFGENRCKTLSGQGESVLRLLAEGTDFDLSYFPLKHLGYKCVVEVTAMLYARLATPRCLGVNLCISAKLDFGQVKELWEGICAAARDYAYENVSLDLAAGVNGLHIAVSAFGHIRELELKRRPAPRSRDLLCLSGNLGGAYMGLRVLEREKKRIQGQDAKGTPEMKGLEKYKLLVGDYLRPVLDADIPRLFCDGGFYPSCGVCVDKGLSDAVKRICRQTGLGAKVYLDRIPFGGGLFDAAREMNIDAASTALNGGEDWRVLFTLPLAQFEKFRHDFQTWQVVGHLAQAEAGAALVMPDGLELPLRAQGWKEEE